MASATITDGRSLPAALDDLYLAVASLIGPRKEMLEGRVLAAPSVYDALVEVIPRGRTRGDNGYSSTVSRSTPTVWVDAIDLRVEIDAAAAAWALAGDSTPARLRAFASRRWRPRDVEVVSEVAEELARFQRAVTTLLEPEHVKEAMAACPACNARYVYRRVDGERIREAALQLTVAGGCTCHSCRATWGPERLLFLCRLLGFEVPAGVLE